MGQIFPGAQVDDLATADWGLAFLHLDGRLANDKPRVIHNRIGAPFAPVLAHHPPNEQTRN